MKEKDESWEGKKTFYKDGLLEAYKTFTFKQWKNMVERERAMWTEYTENEKAPIPKETIEFEEKQQAPPPTQPLPTTPASPDPDVEIELIREELRRRGVRFAYNTGLPKLKEKLAEAQQKDSDATDQE
jgi:hypothetical protein